MKYLFLKATTRQYIFFRSEKNNIFTAFPSDTIFFLLLFYFLFPVLLTIIDT